MNDATDPLAALADWAPVAASARARRERRLVRRRGHRHRPDAVGPHDSGAMVATAFVGTTEDEDVVLARLAAKVSPRVLRQPRELDEARRQLDDYLAGRTRGFTLHTDLALASDFQRVVLPTLAASVGYGHASDVRRAGGRVERPKAARAVGAALGANPLCVVLPCHRVVASSGALTGYAGGLAAKRFLLDLEAGRQASYGVRLPGGQRRGVRRALLELGGQGVHGAAQVGDGGRVGVAVQVHGHRAAGLQRRSLDLGLRGRALLLHRVDELRLGHAHVGAGHDDRQPRR